MSLKQVTEILHNKKANVVALLFHHNADPDALCSAYTLKSLLTRLNPNIEISIVAADSVSRLSRNILKHFSIKLENSTNIENSQVIILLDTNTIQQLNNLGEMVKTSKSPLIFIDHHAPHPETEEQARLYIVDDKASSTCEIIYRFYKEAKVTPTENEAQALFLGIAYDTRHFIIASSSALRVVSELTLFGVNPENTLPLLSRPMKNPERIARLKASERSKIFSIGKWIIATSQVGAYQASAARALVKLGAHFAVVGGDKDGRLRISLRSTPEFYKETGVHIGKNIAKPVGEVFQGMGGGHPTAGGVNGIGEIEGGLQKCLSLLRKNLTKK